MNIRLYDAHNHLQDDRLTPHREAILAALQKEGVTGMVVNGSCEADWPEVLALTRLLRAGVAADGSRRIPPEPEIAPDAVGGSSPSGDSAEDKTSNPAPGYPRMIPSFGYHPWYVKDRSPNWQRALEGHLEAVPSGVGEVGLDRWVRDYDLEQQREVFLWQLRLAAERNLPLSIHCLQAWGPMLNILRAEPRPYCGFLLHSYGGAPELVGPLVELGAYFSLPGYFAHARKTRQCEAFRQVPADRLLIETDAPDQSLPPERTQYPLTDTATGKAINHPANLGAVYRFAAELRNEPLDTLARTVEENFRRLFAGVLRD
jgi:TatD DNase family protein